MKSRSLVLLLGGARSGKSRRAMDLARRADEVYYLATARVSSDDAEWRARIARHRRERPPHWHTIEEPLRLDRAIARVPAGSVAIVDCMTLWLSNVLLAGLDPERECARCLDALADFAGTAILVSNETGMGVVPDSPLGRRFRDAQGFLNQQLAARADRVELIVAGLPMVLKGGDGDSSD
ncbi:MAG: bifunctional adenosylcobinamide kinase/adenosylcobinamide-phosphate guanylyltransferase [Zetaproteobacteria bacterium]|nr:MAG: bifunctional adenosylcobinamide kinase/adenosylcobinamide-phosphate guanylyltransferase [Zetaproteobacteria bacterium]